MWPSTVYSGVLADVLPCRSGYIFFCHNGIFNAWTIFNNKLIFYITPCSPIIPPPPPPTFFTSAGNQLFRVICDLIPKLKTRQGGGSRSGGSEHQVGSGGGGASSSGGTASKKKKGRRKWTSYLITQWPSLPVTITTLMSLVLCVHKFNMPIFLSLPSFTKYYYSIRLSHTSAWTIKSLTINVH